MFLKDNINNMAKDLSKIYNMLLNINPMVPVDSTILAIVYNLIFWEVLYVSLLKRLNGA